MASNSSSSLSPPPSTLLASAAAISPKEVSLRAMSRMDDFPIQTRLPRPQLTLIMLFQRSPSLKGGCWQQKQVSIKTLEGEFSVTMWASGADDGESEIGNP